MGLQVNKKVLMFTELTAYWLILIILSNSSNFKGETDSLTCRKKGNSSGLFIKFYLALFKFLKI